MIQQFELPNEIFLGKKKKQINLNQYRNENPFILGEIKNIYTDIISKQLETAKRYTSPISLHYDIYLKDRNMCDIDNIAAIHIKFFQDCLSKCEIIPDDNFLYISNTSFSFAGVDYNGGHTVVTIKPDNKHDAEALILSSATKHIQNVKDSLESDREAIICSVALYDYLELKEGRTMSKKKISQVFELLPNQFKIEANTPKTKKIILLN